MATVDVVVVEGKDAFARERVVVADVDTFKSSEAELAFNHHNSHTLVPTLLSAELKLDLQKLQQGFKPCQAFLLGPTTSPLDLLPQSLFPLFLLNHPNKETKRKREIPVLMLVFARFNPLAPTWTAP